MVRPRRWGERWIATELTEETRQRRLAELGWNAQRDHAHDLMRCGLAIEGRASTQSKARLCEVCGLAPRDAITQALDTQASPDVVRSIACCLAASASLTPNQDVTPSHIRAPRRTKATRRRSGQLSATRSVAGGSRGKIAQRQIGRAPVKKCEGPQGCLKFK